MLATDTLLANELKSLAAGKTVSGVEFDVYAGAPRINRTQSAYLHRVESDSSHSWQEGLRDLLF